MKLSFDKRKEISDKTFIVDCPYCKAKVAAETSSVAERNGRDYNSNEPYADRLYGGKCPRCGTLLAGKSYQTAFMEWGAEFDEWSDVVRFYGRLTSRPIILRYSSCGSQKFPPDGRRVRRDPPRGHMENQQADLDASARVPHHQGGHDTKDMLADGILS